MTFDNEDAWIPSDFYLQNAQVNELVGLLNVHDYDELYKTSVNEPGRYWQAFSEHTNFIWKTDPLGYVDLARGKEFPTWFPGAQLNWVDTVLRFGDEAGSSNRVAIVNESEDGELERITYGDLAGLVRRTAAGFLSRGIKSGDRVGLLCENGVEATVSMLALSYIGAIMVPLFSGFAPDAIASRLNASGARAIIATTGFDRRGATIDTASAVTEALRRLPEVDLVIWKDSRKSPAPVGSLPWKELTEGREPLRESMAMSPNSPFLIMYTSGTTGKPKGIVHIHGGFPLKVLHDSFVHWDVGPEDVFFWPADMGWVAGPISLCSALLRGATLVCYSGAPDFPDWSRMSRIIERHQVTHYCAVPTLVRGLAAAQSTALQGSRASIRILITTGEVIDLEHFHWFQKIFGDGTAPVINTSGGTEVSAILISSVIVKPIRPASFNTASPSIDVTVVDSDGKAIMDAVGELAVREPFVGMTASFWEDDERYLATYWQKLPGTWLHGDLAQKSSDGSFALLGRSDDTLKIGGKRLGPAEIEEIVLSHEAVEQTAAVGVQGPSDGQKLVIFVVPASDAILDFDLLSREIKKMVAGRLGKAFRPSAIYHVRQLPRTRTSKVLRRLIKQICENCPLGDLSSLDNPESLQEIRFAISESRKDKENIKDRMTA